MLTHHTSRMNVRSAALVVVISVLPLVFAFAAEAPNASRDSVRVNRASSTVTILSGRVTSHSGEPLEGVRIVVAIPATDMRFLDTKQHHKRLKAKTNASGEYRVEIPGITEPTKISMDAKHPGYCSLAGTLMSGSPGTDFEVTPGKAAEASFQLKLALYLKGVVVDEQGKPVAGVKVRANADWKKSSGGVERTVTKSDGSFELFNYPAQPPTHKQDVSKGTVEFSHPNYLSNSIKDIYKLPKVELQSLRIVLDTGNKISGTVVDAAGKPVAGVMIIADHNGDGRKAVTTDANGKFTLQGLMQGATRIRAARARSQAEG